MQPQRVGERKTENRRKYVRFSGEADGWGVAAKGQRDGEEEKAAEGVGENGGYKERALHGFAVAKTDYERIVEAAGAAVPGESVTKSVWTCEAVAYSVRKPRIAPTEM